MLYIGIAVVAVAAVLIAFVSAAVFWMAKNVSRNAKKKTTELISAYDKLIEKKSDELEYVKAEIAVLDAEKKLKESSAVYHGPEEESAPAVFGGSALLTKLNAADYQDGTLFGNYKLIKKSFDISPAEVLRSLDLKGNAGGGFATQLLADLDYDTVYRLSLLPSETQKEVLGSELKAEAGKIFADYVSTHNSFTAIDFYENLKLLASNESVKTKLYVAEGTDVAGVPEDVEIIVDDSICEGFMIEHDNKVYDYCIKEKEIG